MSSPGQFAGAFLSPFLLYLEQLEMVYLLWDYLLRLETYQPSESSTYSNHIRYFQALADNCRVWQDMVY